LFDRTQLLGDKVFMRRLLSQKYALSHEYGGLGACDWFTGDFKDWVISEMNSVGRHYHTMAHVESLASHFTADVQCDMLDGMFNDDLGHPPTEADFNALADIVLPAIVFHDIVYDPTRNDNEERSARIAFARLPAALPLAEIQECIMATKTHKADSLAAKIMCDIDMQVLSKPWFWYLEYARQIRREYIHVPFQDYVRGRSQFLDSVAGKPIYHFPDMSLIDEEQAQYNVRRELELLASQPRNLLLV
jgi:predicted metal-dependent HD superfamily phosphohydrolase